MENKINIAELLKDCPKGMELDCLLCNSPIALEGVAVNESKYPIKAICKDGFIHVFTKYGTLYNHDDAKCVIFPKGQTTWEGFHRPFEDGDIVATGNGIFIGIVKVKNNIQVNSYCATSALGSFSMNIAYRFERFATEEEKSKLFQAIKENGYKWNAETKTLEKLIEPKFKVGDKVVSFGYKFIIAEVKDDYYLTKCGHKISIYDQDIFRLAPNKFDITTLKPFDKVLVRQNVSGKWSIDFFGGYAEGFYYTTGSSMYIQCIPYEGNEHLRGTTDDCDEYYKTWE